MREKESELDRLHQQAREKRNEIKDGLILVKKLQQKIAVASADNPNPALQRLQRQLSHEAESMKDDLEHHDAQYQGLKQITKG